MYQAAAPAASATPVITPLMKPIGSSPSVAGPRRSSARCRRAPTSVPPTRSGLDDAPLVHPGRSVHPNRRVGEPCGEVERERAYGPGPKGWLHGRADRDDDHVRASQQRLGAHPGLEPPFIEVQRAAERKQLPRPWPADRERRPVGRHVDDGAATSLIASRRAVSRAGPVPGSPRISHSSGPSQGRDGCRRPRRPRCSARSAAGAEDLARRAIGPRPRVRPQVDLREERQLADTRRQLDASSGEWAAGRASCPSRGGLPGGGGVARPVAVLGVEDDQIDDLRLHRAVDQGREHPLADPVAAALDECQ